MMYVTLMPEWPKGSGVRQAWAGWYPPGSGLPSVIDRTDGRCPITAVADVYEQLAASQPRSRPCASIERGRRLFE